MYYPEVLLSNLFKVSFVAEDRYSQWNEEKQSNKEDKMDNYSCLVGSTVRSNTLHSLVKIGTLVNQ